MTLPLFSFILYLIRDWRIFTRRRNKCLTDCSNDNSRKQKRGNGRSHLIELHQVSKIFHVGSGDFVALDSVDFLVDKGEYVAVMGKSGSGKSTLVNMISGIDRPSSGEIIVAGINLNHLKEGEWPCGAANTLG